MTASHQGRRAPVLSIEGLCVEYRIGPDWRTAVQDVSFDIEEGASLGLVGESGCGKSTIALAVMDYLPRNGRIAGGRVEFGGRDLGSYEPEELRRLRARHLSMVYQDPSSALNPSMRIGRQVAEVFALLGERGSATRTRVCEALEKVRIADPLGVARRYPHQLSGGMQQRVVIAMAIVKDPALLILDEPTTGLDATVEAEILDLVRDLQRESGTAVLFVSHSLGVIEAMCDRTAVLYAGRMAAMGASGDVFEAPRHPYTLGLLRSLPAAARGRRRTLETIPGFLPELGAAPDGCVYAPRCPIARDLCRRAAPPPVDLGRGRKSWCHFPDEVSDIPRTEAAPEMAAGGGSTLLEVRNAVKTFTGAGSRVQAVRGVDLTVAEGETVALVGESGSGKTTLAKMILGIHEPDEGAELTLGGGELPGSLRKRTADQTRAIQMVFQNPDSALNRRHLVKRIIGRAVRCLRGDRDPGPRVAELAEAVRMGRQTLSVRPSQLSGGLKQRVAIARAFAGAPRLVVADEPTSALDVSVQAAILNLLNELQAQARVSYLFISHDLGVVRYIADRVAVMYLGQILEDGPAGEVFAGPHHPYTEALLSAAPGAGAGRRIRLEGEVPSPTDLPAGCVFHTRCHRKLAGDVCETTEPALTEATAGGHRIRCHIPVDELTRQQGG